MPKLPCIIYDINGEFHWYKLTKSGYVKTWYGKKFLPVNEIHVMPDTPKKQQMFYLEPRKNDPLRAYYTKIVYSAVGMFFEVQKSVLNVPQSPDTWLSSENWVLTTRKQLKKAVQDLENEKPD